MEWQPKVSVLMPSLNVAPYIRQSLDSVLHQTLKDIEIICIDAGSTDGTWEIIRELSKDDPRVTILKSERKSYGYQMNLGLRHAQGDYIGIVETDDFAAPEMFESLYRKAISQKAQVVKSGYYRYSEKDRMQSVPVDPYFAFPYNKVFSGLKRPDILLPEPAIWTGLYERSFLERNGIGFLETPGASYQDTGFIMKVWICAERILLFRGEYLHYRTDNAASSVKSKEKAFYICDEYASVEEFLAAQGPERQAAFRPWLMARKEHGYYWNYIRLSDERKPEFLARYVEEFSQCMAAGELSRSAFRHKAWERLTGILSAPEAHVPDPEWDVDHSSSLRYLREHGMRFVLRKAHEKIRLRRLSKRSAAKNH